MQRQPISIDGTNMGRRWNCKNFMKSNNKTEVDQNDYGRTDVLLNVRAQNYFNNPVSAFLVTVSSIIFWCIYWMAKALIAIAGIFIIISLICPHKLFGLFNHFTDQHEREEKFREEL